MFKNTKYAFYKDIQKNLASILLNYGKKENTKIEIIVSKEN